MYFSGKITHSVLNFVNKNGLDFEGVFDQTDIPIEFLRDPSCWLEAAKVETFLAAIEKEYCSHFPGENFIEKVGHSCFELKAWGALDSVLRMMQNPLDIYTQPQRFISYFVSPPPPIGNLLNEDGRVSFELPISSLEFPYVTEYLRCALEALPTFMNADMAVIVWNENQIEITWSHKQTHLFSGRPEDQNIDPEFVRSLVSALEHAEKELEVKAQKMAEKDQEISELRLQAENMKSSLSSFRRQVVSLTNSSIPSERLSTELEKGFTQIHSEVLRLNDYLARAQQLITLLVAQDRKSPQVREAMRRVDWEFVRKNYSEIVKSVGRELSEMRSHLRGEEVSAAQVSPVTFPEKSDLSNMIDEAIRRAKIPKSPKVQLNKMLFFNESIPVFKDEFQSALQRIIENCSHSMADQPGVISIVTRPRGAKAEIEISDTGQGIGVDEFFSSPEGAAITEAVRRHNGEIRLESHQGSGSTFVMELPISSR